MTSVAGKLGWSALALLGAFCLGTVALHRGETINAIWFDRAHDTMWGGSSNHGEDYGIAW